MILPPSFWITTAFLLGITIGSFLNVVIWRLPRASAALTLSVPTWSMCPNCERRLTAVDLVPLLSFLFLGARCRSCKQPISWRYFGVELMTGLLFVVLTLRFLPNAPDAIALILFTAVLIPIFFIDLELFLIPDTLNLAAFVIALGRDAWGIVQHEPGHELLGGWLPRSILGAVVGVLIFGTVRVLGWLWKRVEAMGLGDPLLARAMGAMLVSITPLTLHPLALFPMWVLLSCFSGLIVGPALIFLRNRQAKTQEAAAGPSAQADEPSDEDLPLEDESSLGEQLFAVGYCLWLGDLIDYLRDKFSRPAGETRTTEAETEAAVELDDSPPAPTAIPFGPFLIVGFLATVFVGEWLTRLYMSVAFPKP
jgi:leader peptidase (prepilin peptidase)/N-methyltransferase